MTPDLLTRMEELADSHDIRFGLYEPYVREAMALIRGLEKVAEVAEALIPTMEFRKVSTQQLKAALAALDKKEGQ